MASNCRTCGGGIEWAYDEATSKWVPLEPVATQGDLARTHVDLNGELRADHRLRHGGGNAITVTRLRQAVPAEMAAGNEGAIVASTRRRARKAAAKKEEVTDAVGA